MSPTNLRNGKHCTVKQSTLGEFQGTRGGRKVKDTLCLPQSLLPPGICNDETHYYGNHQLLACFTNTKQTGRACFHGLVWKLRLWLTKKPEWRLQSLAKCCWRQESSPVLLFPHDAQYLLALITSCVPWIWADIFIHWGPSWKPL